MWVKWYGLENGRVAIGESYGFDRGRKAGPIWWGELVGKEAMPDRGRESS